MQLKPLPRDKWVIHLDRNGKWGIARSTSCGALYWEKPSSLPDDFFVINNLEGVVVNLVDALALKEVKLLAAIRN